MADRFEEREGVMWPSGRRTLKGAETYRFGLVLYAKGGTLEVVPVQPITDKIRMYYDAVNDEDACKDNVPLEECPPLFGEMFEDADVVYFDIDDGGEMGGEVRKAACYAYADIAHPIRVDAARCTSSCNHEKLCDRSWYLVWNHGLQAQSQKDASSELPFGDDAESVRGDDDVDIHDDEELEDVSPFGRGSMDEQSERKLQEQARQEERLHTGDTGFCSAHADTKPLKSLESMKRSDLIDVQKDDKQDGHNGLGG